MLRVATNMRKLRYEIDLRILTPNTWRSWSGWSGKLQVKLISSFRIIYFVTLEYALCFKLSAVTAHLARHIGIQRVHAILHVLIMPFFVSVSMSISFLVEIIWTWPFQTRTPHIDQFYSNRSGFVTKERKILITNFICVCFCVNATQ